MSRAFVKETDGEEIYDDLPDRPIDPRPNLVTPEGLTAIEAEVLRLQTALAEAQSREARAEIAELSRDLRYWQSRRASAEVARPAEDCDQVRFGLSVGLRYEDGRQMTYRIVGIDEADPVAGRLSYVAPLAQAMLGKRVGDSVSAGKQGEAEIVAIVQSGTAAGRH
jgi:transcription elongation GreA/GreB family factor